MKISFIRKTQCYCLTWFGRVLIFVLLISSFYCFFVKMPFFLSRSNAVHGDILVLDGNMPDFVLEEAVSIYRSGAYKQIVTTGGDFLSGCHISEIKSMAEFSRRTFIALKVEPEKVTAISSGLVYKNRTYTSALSLKSWLESNSIATSGIDVVTAGCHARRSEFLFQKALGDKYDVGVISVADLTYDINKWWTSSKGMRTVISEMIAYLYVVLFF